MSRAWKCAAVALLSAAAAAGQTAVPAAGTGGPALTPAEIDQKMQAMIALLPTTSVKAPPPTLEQRKLSEKGCELYTTASAQLGQLDPQIKLNLSLIGIRSGFGAGDAEVMLSAARLRWEIEKAAGSVSDYAAYVLSWAGIFAGEPKAALQGLQHLARQSEQQGLRSWAKGMGPVAAQAGRPLKHTFRLMDGKSVSLPALAGKVVILNFWSSHSVAAVREMATLKAIHTQHHKDASFVMLGVSLDRNQADARRRIAQHRMSWPQAMDRGLRSRFLGVGVPHVVVISAKGYVLWQGHPALKDTLVRTTDFALRQAERIGKHSRPAATQPERPEKPAVRKPPPKPSRPRPTPEQEAQAENKWKIARMYLRMRLLRKGKETLQEIVQQYPGTRAAVKAAERLKYLH